MTSQKPPPGIIPDDLLTWIAAFMRSRQALGVSAGTIHYYQIKFLNLTRFAQEQQIANVQEITPDAVRQFLLHLAGSHAPGDVHAHYRALRALFNFYVDEADPEHWHNPMLKVKPPKTPATLLEPVDLDIVQTLVDSCNATPIGLRDRAALLMLIDTGARAVELVKMNRPDMNLITGEGMVNGKGSKQRRVYIGKTTRLALRKYIRSRTDDHPALIATVNGERLSYWGLRDMIEHRSQKAGISPPPSLHSFRRAFALNCLREGMDIYTLKELMGHADLQTLQRYIKLTDQDLAASHARFSPGDRLD